MQTFTFNVLAQPSQPFVSRSFFKTFLTEIVCSLNTSSPFPHAHKQHSFYNLSMNLTIQEPNETIQHLSFKSRLNSLTISSGLIHAKVHVRFFFFETGLYCVSLASLELFVGQTEHKLTEILCL